MIHVSNSTFGPGLVGVTGQETGRFHAFTASVTGVYVPAMSELTFCLGYDTAYNSNACIRAMLANPKFEWTWILDDDHIFDRHSLLKLLAHRQDLVVPLYAQRFPPFLPCIYKAELETSYEQFTYADLKGAGTLQPIVSAGKGGIFIRRPLLEAMPPPWFERQGLVGEDHYFFQKARALGVQPYCALDVPFGHITPVVIFPQHVDGSWGAKIDCGNDVFVDVAPAEEPVRG